ncbi:MAG: hypothetical protein RMJ59_06635 [Candidatus Nitrosocaldus sp.]|nr:hypothetical protein [Candidatus Nitrosocaldus sp.]MDW8276036.1 hypothetical protein [Candidatus Nitrosocaldus sp.]
MENVIAVYCRSSEGVSTDGAIPRHVMNRLDTAKNLLSRLVRSHADDSLIKVILFAGRREEGEHYARLLPHEGVGVEECSNIADMAEKVLTMIGFYSKGRDEGNYAAKRVYFVLSNWQWQYIEPLLRLKDERVRFFFEGALDERSVEEIEAEMRMEGKVRLRVENSFVDRLMGMLTSDLKG